MVFTILHNEQDEASRAFVAAHADDPDVDLVLSWYDEDDRDAWVAAGGTLAVSAFPSIVYDRPELDDVHTVPVTPTDPAYRADPEGYAGPTTQRRQIRPSGLEVVRLIAHDNDSLPFDHARARRARHLSAAAVSWVEAVATVEGAQVVATEADRAAEYIDQAAAFTQPDGRLARHAERLAAARAGTPISPRERDELGSGPLVVFTP